MRTTCPRCAQSLPGDGVFARHLCLPRAGDDRPRHPMSETLARAHAEAQAQRFA